MEIEAKYRALEHISPEQVESLDFSPYMLGPREFHDLHDVLLDTEERDIGSDRHALRVRRDGERVFLTLKGPKTVRDSTTLRSEWEERVESDDPFDLSTWPPAFLERVREMSRGKRLYPLLRVRNKRHTWPVLRSDTVVAEIALDRGTIEAGSAKEPMHEVEVEIKEGDEADLVAIVDVLVEALALVPETRGKAERGLALLAGQSNRGE